MLPFYYCSSHSLTYLIAAHVKKKKVAGILHFHIQSSPKLTPQKRVLLEKLMVLQQVKNFHSAYGIQRFITQLARDQHQSSSCAR
jgi:hypothetical protein